MLNDLPPDERAVARRALVRHIKHEIGRVPAGDTYEALYAGLCALPIEGKAIDPAAEVRLALDLARRLGDGVDDAH
jgi:hypothetical protein